MYHLYKFIKILDCCKNRLSTNSLLLGMLNLTPYFYGLTDNIDNSRSPYKGISNGYSDTPLSCAYKNQVTIYLHITFTDNLTDKLNRIILLKFCNWLTCHSTRHLTSQIVYITN